MTNIETPEMKFGSKIIEMVANADTLIDVYIETLAEFETLPDGIMDTEQKDKAIELTTLTLETLMELKVAVKHLYEHSSEVHDKIASVLSKLETQIKKD